MNVVNGLISLAGEVLMTMGLFFAFAVGYVFLLVFLPALVEKDLKEKRRCY